jgi:phage/plasmid-like protein (TIGR03299 family)
MSHGIENLNGKDSMAYTGETPWHGLGTYRENGWATTKELLEDAGINWKVEAKQLYYETKVDGKVKRFRVPNTALVRDVDGKALSTISKDWNPIQNDEAFEFFNNLVHTGKLTLETAGSLFGGRRVWGLAKVQSEFELKVDGKKTKDVVSGFLLLTNPHEYGKSIDARLCATRVVCQNTLAVALGEHGALTVSLNHRRPFDAAKMQEMLGIAHLSMDHYKEQAEFLASKRYDLEKAKEFFGKVFPFANGEADKQEKASRMAKAAADIIETQPGADVAPGTWWNAFNAVTFAVDHLAGFNADTRLQSQWYGHGRARKTEAMDLAINYATHS